jgi:hypothetical protein
LRWLRSWPRLAGTMPDRPHVVDRMERLVISDYDYGPLAGLGCSVIVLEWDLAMDCEEMATFEAECSDEPARVRVAPYRLHDSAGHRWAHRVVLDGEAGEERFVTLEDPFCDLFGFGAVYLPWPLVARFLAAPAPERGRPPWCQPGAYEDCRFTDQTFSTWHYRAGLGPVPICWDVVGVHLNDDGGAIH